MNALRNRNGKGMVLFDENIVDGIPTTDEFEESGGRLSDPVAHVKLFTVTGWQWYVIALDPEPWVALCYVVAPGDELELGEFGIVSIRELSELTLFSGSLGVERDIAFRAQTMSQVAGYEA